MTYDPAWDMPLVNWRQQGSFSQAIPPIGSGPLDTPLVCLPPINQDWLPVVMGCLDQLCNPSTWSTADDTALNLALEAAQSLKQAFGVRAVCPVPFELQMSGCSLQYSTDGGATFTTVTGWTDFLDDCIPPQTLLSFDSGCTLSESLDGGTTYNPVSGWIENFSECVQEYTPIIGLPPNPGDQDPDQLACSIATYLAENVIVNAMSAAVTVVQDNLTLLSLSLSILDFIPEFVIVRAGVDAIAGIYGYVSEGTLTDYEDAISDGTLLVDITCAIYSAIVGDGYVTPTNFSSILANIGAISYSHSDVLTAIVGYLTALGPTELAQLSQVAGLESGADCSGCASTWCRTYDFTISAYAFGWSGENGGFYAPGIGWASTPCSDTIQCLDFENGSTGTFTIDEAELVGQVSGGASTVFLLTNSGVSDYIDFGAGVSGPFDITKSGPMTVSSLRIVLITNGVTPQDCIISKMVLKGSGSPPVFGVPC